MSLGQLNSHKFSAKPFQVLDELLSERVIAQGDNTRHNVEEQQRGEEHLDDVDIAAGEELWNDDDVNEHLADEGKRDGGHGRT